MSLKNIDFSDGIRSEDIQFNFEEISDQIAKERLAVAGHGISTGLNFTINGFDLTIGEGSLIDLDGNEVMISETILKIPYPEIVTTSEIEYEIQVGGMITLPDFPYSAERTMAAQYDLAIHNGISLVDSTTNRELEIIQISGKTVIVSSSRAGQKAKISYRKTNKRYDTVYIGKDNKIKIMGGISSSSPSVSIPDKSICKYILGIIKINPFYVGTDSKMVAKLTIERDMKSLRNLYTDSSNELFIKGVPFDDLQIIHISQPLTPIENQLWYDVASNKLKVWRTLDGISEWQYVNDTSVIPVMEYKIWTPETNPDGRQVFIFAKDSDMNMRFSPGKNELEIYVDNGPLHSDQFEEVTVAQAMLDVNLKLLLTTDYEYTEEWLDNANDTFENVGIGFRLAQPLDRDVYLEVRATHRVNDNPTSVRFQRSATFVESDTFTYLSGNGNVITTLAPYRIGENQLEVFIDGKRLDPVVNFTEGRDLVLEARTRGMSSFQFEITSAIPENARISYKVTSNIYSYDNVENMVADLTNRIELAEATVSTNSAAVTTLINTAATEIGNLTIALETLEQNDIEHASFIKKTDTIDVLNMPESVMAGIPKGFINTTITKTGNVMQLTGIYPEDFITMFDMQATGGNSILRRGTDYSITRDSITNAPYLEFLNTNLVADGHSLYITGIKFQS